MEQVELEWTPSIICFSDTLVHIYFRDPSIKFGFYAGVYRCGNTTKIRRTRSLVTFIQTGMLKKAAWFPRFLD